MEITMTLSEDSKKILLRRLGIKDLSEVLDWEYSDFETEKGFNKEKAKLYNKNMRGSVRLKIGRYYSPTEIAERERRIKNLKLP